MKKSLILLIAVLGMVIPTFSLEKRTFDEKTISPEEMQRIL